MFVHDPIVLPKLKDTTLPDGTRFYDTPSGNKYPSVTTVLSAHNKKAILDWRQRVGAEEANKVSRQAGSRGNRIHKLVENYLDNQEIDWSKYSLLDKENFSYIQPILHRINNIRVQEAGLFSHHLRLAGRVDCIAEFDGTLSIIDFKTSLRQKDKSYIENYFMQLAGYAIMFEEMTGIPISRGVVIISVDGDAPQIFIVKRDNWVKGLIHYRDEFERLAA